MDKKKYTENVSTKKIWKSHNFIAETWNNYKIKENGVGVETYHHLVILIERNVTNHFEAS